MESFFLAETSKYLFLLFSNASAILDHYVLSTEGHLLPILPSPAVDEAPPHNAFDSHAKNAVVRGGPDGVCPTLWRQRECAAVCAQKPTHVMEAEVSAITICSCVCPEVSDVLQHWRKITTLVQCQLRPIAH
jgi:hypothetical protein